VIDGVVIGRIILTVATVHAPSVVVGVVVGRVVQAAATSHAPSVVVDIVVGRVILATAMHLNLRRGAAAVAVALDGVIGTASSQAREGDPPLQRFELEPTSNALFSRLHGGFSVCGC